MAMGATEKRIQRKSRESYGCAICGKTIWENCDYIAVTVKNDQGVRKRYKRHIHCDALIRLYAERNDKEPAEVPGYEIKAWLESVCEAECMPGFSKRCGQDRFSCGQILWLLLRHKPGFGAIQKSAARGEGEEDA